MTCTFFLKFHLKNQHDIIHRTPCFHIKKLGTVAMATVVSQHVCHLGNHLGFFKNFVLRKNAANFSEISRKHVFEDFSNRNIIENRV